MRTRLNLIQKTIGVGTVLLFLGTGLLMKFHFSRIYEANPLVRMMFRSIHIYILLAGLHNIVAGTYLAVSNERRKRAGQIAGSICLLLAPAVLIGAFFFEPVRETMERRTKQIGIILLLVGTILHMLSAPPRDRQRSVKCLDCVA